MIRSIIVTLRAVLNPAHWINGLMVIISVGLLLRGRMIGVGFTISIFIIKWMLSRSPILSNIKSKLGGKSKAPLALVMASIPVSVGATFVLINQLPFLGDMSLQNYRSLGLIWACFMGYGYLISQEMERPPRVLIPLIVVAVYTLLSLGLMIDKEYVIVAMLLVLGCVSIGHWWLDQDSAFPSFQVLSSHTVVSPLVFIIGQVAAQDRLAVLFGNGLLLQHFYVLPGLFLGFFGGIYIGKFDIKRSSLALFLLTPIMVSIVLRGEAGLAFWIAFTFSTFVASLIYPLKYHQITLLSLMVTGIMFTSIAELQSIALVLDTNLRSLIGILTVGFWMVVALFGNTIRKEPIIESHRAVIKKRRDKGR